jgi:hypothetical protein
MLAHPLPRYNLPMSQTAAEILEAARQLPRHQQRWIGHELPGEDESESPAEVEAAWGKEIKRRLDEIDSGAVQMVPLDDVLARMKTRIASKKRA